MCTPTLTPSSMMLSRTMMCNWTRHSSLLSSATVTVTLTAVLTNQVLKKWLFRKQNLFLLLKAKQKVMLHPPLPHATRSRISMYIFMSSWAPLPQATWPTPKSPTRCQCWTMALPIHRLCSILYCVCRLHQKWHVVKYDKTNDIKIHNGANCV